MLIFNNKDFTITLPISKLTQLYQYLYLWEGSTTFSVVYASHNSALFHSARYPLMHGEQIQQNMKSLPDTSTHVWARIEPLSFGSWVCHLATCFHGDKQIILSIHWYKYFKNTTIPLALSFFSLLQLSWPLLLALSVSGLLFPSLGLWFDPSSSQR